MANIEIIKKFFSKNYLSILVVILFLAFFFLLHWNSFDSPWERDEGEYAYSAWLMTQDKIPYRDSFVQKPPLIIYTYYFSQLIKPLALWPPRVLGFIFTLSSCILLAMIAKKLYGPKAAWFALWVSPLLLTLPSLFALAANTEKFMLLPLIGLLALFVFYKDEDKKIIYFFAGALSSLAILYKPIALMTITVLLIYWLSYNWRSNKDINKLLVAGGYIFFGVLITVFLSLAYFIFNGAMGDMWQQVVVYNASYVADMKRYFPGLFFHYLKLFLNSWPLIILLTVSAFILRPKLLFLLWFLLLVSLLSVCFATVGHYYLLIMPFLILISAGAYIKFIDKLEVKEEEWKNVILAAIVIITISISFSMIAEQFFFSPQGLSIWIYGEDNPFNESDLVAQKIKENTKLGEKIFIAGSEPQIYYFSQRESVSKFDITYPVSTKTVWADIYQSKIINDLNKNKPAAIILSLRSSSGFLNQAPPILLIDYLSLDLKNNFRLIGGVGLDSEKKAFWEDAGRISQQSDLSFLLYIRK